jgi:hypothetical protein
MELKNGRIYKKVRVDCCQRTLLALIWIGYIEENANFLARSLMETTEFFWTIIL